MEVVIGIDCICSCKPNYHVNCDHKKEHDWKEPIDGIFIVVFHHLLCEVWYYNFHAGVFCIQ